MQNYKVSSGDVGVKGLRNDTIEGQISKIKWTSSKKELATYQVVVIDRGVSQGFRTINLGEGVTILKDRLVIGETVIPLHRVVEIRKEGVVVWRRNALAGKSEG
jgi:uncharacterized protein (UPF0248 family)